MNARPRRRAMPLVVLLFSALVLGAGAACGDQGTSDDGDDDGVPTIDAAPPTGKFTLAWTLTDGAAAVTCAQVKAETVLVRLTPVSGAPGTLNAFPCAAGTGTTPDREALTYHVDLLLRDAAGNTMAELPRRTGVLLPAGAPTTLDPAAFTVETSGSVRFTVDAAGASGLNCAAEATSGAGLSKVRFELQTTNMTCVPTAFAVAAGAMGTAESTAAACPGAQTASCVEGDQLVTAALVPAGDYRLVAEAFEAGSPMTPCYKTVAQFQVAGGVDVDLDILSLNLDAMNMACVAP